MIWLQFGYRGDFRVSSPLVFPWFTDAVCESHEREIILLSKVW